MAETDNSTILNYLSGRLSPADMEAFEARLAAEPQLWDQVRESAPFQHASDRALRAMAPEGVANALFGAAAGTAAEQSGRISRMKFGRRFSFDLPRIQPSPVARPALWETLAGSSRDGTRTRSVLSSVVIHIVAIAALGLVTFGGNAHPGPVSQHQQQPFLIKFVTPQAIKTPDQVKTVAKFEPVQQQKPVLQPPTKQPTTQPRTPQRPVPTRRPVVTHIAMPTPRPVTPVFHAPVPRTPPVVRPHPNPTPPTPAPTPTPTHVTPQPVQPTQAPPTQVQPPKPTDVAMNATANQNVLTPAEAAGARGQSTPQSTPEATTVAENATAPSTDSTFAPATSSTSSPDKPSTSGAGTSSLNPTNEQGSQANPTVNGGSSTAAGQSTLNPDLQAASGSGGSAGKPGGASTPRATEMAMAAGSSESATFGGAIGASGASSGRRGPSGSRMSSSLGNLSGSAGQATPDVGPAGANSRAVGGSAGALSSRESVAGGSGQRRGQADARGGTAGPQAQYVAELPSSSFGSGSSMGPVFGSPSGFHSPHGGRVSPAPEAGGETGVSGGVSLPGSGRVGQVTTHGGLTGLSVLTAAGTGAPSVRGRAQSGGTGQVIAMAARPSSGEPSFYGSVFGGAGGGGGVPQTRRGPRTGRMGIPGGYGGGSGSGMEIAMNTRGRRQASGGGGSVFDTGLRIAGSGSTRTGRRGNGGGSLYAGGGPEAVGEAGGNMSGGGYYGDIAMGTGTSGSGRRGPRMARVLPGGGGGDGSTFDGVGGVSMGSRGSAIGGGIGPGGHLDYGAGGSAGRPGGQRGQGTGSGQGGPEANGEAGGVNDNGGDGSGYDTGAVEGGGTGAGGPAGPGAHGVGNVDISGAGSGGEGVGGGLDTRRGLLKDVEARTGIYADLSGNYELPVVKHAGDYNWHFQALSNLLNEVSSRTNVKVRMVSGTVDPATQSIKDSPLVVFTGHKNFGLTPEQEAGLKKFVQQGGVIWGDFSGGGTFNNDFLAEMEKLFGSAQEIPLGSDVYTSRYTMDQIPTGYYGRNPKPFLGIRMPGSERYAVIITPNSYLDSLDNGGSDHYDDAAKVGVNIYLYAVHVYQDAQANGEAPAPDAGG